jgi:hypothetical protein
MEMNIIHGVVRAGLVALAGICVASLVGCGGGGDAGPTPSAAPDAEKTSARALAASVSTTGEATASAGARPVSFIKYNAGVAIGDFVDIAADGCTWTFAQITAYPKGSRSALNFQAFIYDYCTGQYGDYFYGSADDAKVVINEHGAFARATLPLESSAGVIKKVEINLTWNGGVARTDNTKTINIGPDIKIISKTSSSFKFADTVTGSIVIDGDDYLSSSHNSGINGYTVTYGETTIQIVRTH